MRLTNSPWFSVPVDLVHDITGGAWVGGALVLWMVRRGAGATLTPEVLDTLVRSWTWIVTLLFAALVLQVATGLMRVSYRNTTTSPEAQATKGRVALIKHAVFVTLFIAAAVAAFSVLQP